MNDEGMFAAGISKAEIARVRQLIGRPLQIEQWNHEASYDAIRHWSYGIGDDNPLWNDEIYAAGGPHGTMVAPPSFLFSIFGPSIRPGFPGCPSLQGGGRLEIDRYVHRGERLTAEARLLDLLEKKSAKVGTIVIGIGETIYRTADGHKVGTYISRGIRIPPPAPRERRLYEPREPYHYTQEELSAIEKEILAQQRRGSKIRYWEDVNIGDRVPACVKGPLDFPTMACFHAGLGPIGYASADIAVKRRHAVPQASARQPYSIAPETAPTRSSASADGHDDPNVAQAAGMPGAFDIGWQRISWMIQGLTDWAGDTGRLQMIDVRLVSPNVIGDTTWCQATVTQKRIARAMHVVDLKAEAERQDREISAVGTATVVLPSRSASVRSIDRTA